MRAPGARHANQFANIAIVVLKQKVRAFTAHWHKAALAGAFNDLVQCQRFRTELAELQEVLTHYAGLLSDLAGVEDLTRIGEGSTLIPAACKAATGSTVLKLFEGRIR